MRNAILTLGLVTAAFPAAAQNHFSLGRPESSLQTAVLARWETAAFPLGVFSRNFEGAAAQNAEYEREFNIDPQLVVPTTETPFELHRDFPVATHPDGRFEFGGFFDYRPVENFLLGLPGGGALPAWSVSARTHAGVLTPRAEGSFGMSFTVRLGRDAQLAPHAQGWRCLGRLIGFRQSCRVS